LARGLSHLLGGIINLAEFNLSAVTLYGSLESTNPVVSDVIWKSLLW